MSARKPKAAKPPAFHLIAAEHEVGEAQLAKLFLEFAEPELRQLSQVSVQTIKDILLWSVAAWHYAFADESLRQQILTTASTQMGPDYQQRMERQMARRRSQYADNKAELGGIQVKALGAKRYALFVSPRSPSPAPSP